MLIGMIVVMRRYLETLPAVEAPPAVVGRRRVPARAAA